VRHEEQVFEHYGAIIETNKEIKLIKGPIVEFMDGTICDLEKEKIYGIGPGYVRVRPKKNVRGVPSSIERRFKADSLFLVEALGNISIEPHDSEEIVVNIEGDHATGTAYCQVVLIGNNEEGKRMMNTNGVWYEDEYIKLDGKWLIANRTSHFTWADSKEV
jgi:hypothetical protein